MMPQNVFGFTLPATYRCLDALEPYLDQVLAAAGASATDAALRYKLILAVHEACTNIIRHAYAGQPGQISLICALFDTPRRVQIVLRDRGRPFDAAAVALPNLDQPQEHGYGLFLMRELLDEVAYTRTDGCNRWQLVKRL